MHSTFHVFVWLLLFQLLLLELLFQDLLLSQLLLLCQRSFASNVIKPAICNFKQKAQRRPKVRGGQIKFNLNASVERHTLGDWNRDFDCDSPVWGSGVVGDLGQQSPHPPKGRKIKVICIYLQNRAARAGAATMPRTWCTGVYARGAGSSFWPGREWDVAWDERCGSWQDSLHCLLICSVRTERKYVAIPIASLVDLNNNRY